MELEQKNSVKTRSRFEVKKSLLKRAWSRGYEDGREMIHMLNDRFSTRKKEFSRDAEEREQMRQEIESWEIFQMA
jgi:hypothetical protein